MLRAISVGLTRLLAAVALTGGMSAAALAQPYPAKQIHLVIPYAPGGFNDSVGRLIADKLGISLGQRIIVDNRPGANSMVAAEYTAKAPADGYTVLVVPGGHALFSSLYPTMSYDPLKDLTGVSLLGRISLVMVGSAKLPIHNLAELRAYSKAHPDTLSLATSGVGSLAHLSLILFNQATGLNILHVPYKGLGPAMPDLLSGRVSLALDTFQLMGPQINEGKLFGVGFAGHARWPGFSNIPTFDEQGLTGFTADAFIGLVVAAKTPRDIVTRLSSELDTILKLSDVREKLLSYGLEPVGGTAESFDAFLKSEHAKWAKVIKDANVKLED